MQVSVVNFSITTRHRDFRLDAEFYKPTYLKLDDELRKHRHELLGNLVKEIRCGPFGSTLLAETYLEDGVIVIRPFNIKNFTIERDNLVWIDEKDCVEKRLKFYSAGDLFFSRVGDVRCGVVPKFDNKITISPNIIAVKSDKDKLNPYYAAIFFNTKFGFPQIERGLKVVAQPTIQTDLVSNLKIVLFSQPFQLLFESIFKIFFKLDGISNNLYNEAEHLLLSELGLPDWQPKHQLSFVKNFSDTQESERIDAEYFQPKYNEIVDAVKNYKGGWGTLGDLVNIKDRNFNPKDDVVYKYIELANIGSNGEITGSTEELGKELPTRARRIVSAGDVIVSSIEGSLPSVALITEEFNKALCSTGFYVINSKFYNSETLFCLTKSLVGQMQLKKGCNGTMLTAINKDEISKIILPKISDQIQRKIKDKISLVYETRKKSKHLLEIAKRGVEMTIEQDEKTAEEWINQNIPLAIERGEHLT